MADEKPSALAAIWTGIRMRCPRCKKGKLFQGFLKFRPKCDNCGLDFSAGDTADGPAVFIIFLAGAIVVAGAMVVELKYAPPMWVHLALWVPLTIIISLSLLRPLKGVTFVLQYFYKAGTIEYRENWKDDQ